MMTNSRQPIPEVVIDPIDINDAQPGLRFAEENRGKAIDGIRLGSQAQPLNDGTTAGRRSLERIVFRW
jgi:hypothetical protein